MRTGCPQDIQGVTGSVLLFVFQHLDADFMTTPHFKFFVGTKPDYRIPFPFGCIGPFCQAQDGNHNCNNFESQCMLGITLGRSEYTNGMVFYNPIMDSFCTSADYLINKNCHVGKVFPSLRKMKKSYQRIS